MLFNKNAFINIFERNFDNTA